MTTHPATQPPSHTPPPRASASSPRSLGRGLSTQTQHLCGTSSPRELTDDRERPAGPRACATARSSHPGRTHSIVRDSVNARNTMRPRRFANAVARGTGGSSRHQRGAWWRRVRPLNSAGSRGRRAPDDNRALGMGRTRMRGGVCVSLGGRAYQDVVVLEAVLVQALHNASLQHGQCAR